MATMHADFDEAMSVERSERRFFLVMAVVMAATTVAGFAFNVAMGRSTFAAPLFVHIHAFVFLSWLALYIGQTWLIARNDVRLHRALGVFATGWVLVMAVVGTMMSISTLKRTGGPFFFDQNQFLFSNIAQLFCFVLVILWAVRERRYRGWHRRLMYVAMASITSPGLGRLLPLPLMIPNAWHIGMAATLVFVVAGVIADLKHHRRVHPAWFWGVACFVGAQVAADMLAYSPWGEQVTRDLLAGSPGAKRPMAAFLPPGFAP